MDTSTLTPLIQALRTETQEESISPESLGSLLQKIVNVLAQAAAEADMQNVLEWKTIVAQISTVITDLTPGAENRNNVLLNFASVNPTTGQSVNNSLLLNSATTERAGVMKAEQVTDLNQCKTSITNILSTLSSLATSLQEVKTTADSTSESLTEESEKILGLQNDLQIISVVVDQLEENMDKLESMSETMIGHIEVEAINGSLMVHGPLDKIIRLGLVPYIFRYSVKYHRIRPNKTYTRRIGPKKKGWHLLYDILKCRMDANGYLYFRSDHEDISKGSYSTHPKYLFAVPTEHYDEENRLAQITVPFGKYSYDVLTGDHSFRFGIGFGLPKTGGRDFAIKQLKTNIAQIKVVAHKKNDEIDFIWSR